MDYTTNNNKGTNGNKQGELQHNYPLNEGVEISTRYGGDGKYSNHEKAVTQPTPSSDKVDD